MEITNEKKVSIDRESKEITGMDYLGQTQVYENEESTVIIGERVWKDKTSGDLYYLPSSEKAFELEKWEDLYESVETTLKKVTSEVVYAEGYSAYGEKNKYY